MKIDNINIVKSCFVIFSSYNGKIKLNFNNTSYNFPKIECKYSFDDTELAKKYIEKKLNKKVERGLFGILKFDVNKKTIIYGVCFKNIDLKNKINANDYYSFDKVLKTEINSLNFLIMQFASSTKEFKDIFYLLNDVKCISLQKVGAYLKEIDKNRCLLSFESPDIVIDTKEYAIALECFDIDSSDTSIKSGSTEVQKLKKLKEDLENSNQTEKHDKVSINHSINSLLTNYRNNFNNHYVKIEKYVERTKLLVGNKRIIKGFFITDTTNLGTYASSDKGSGYLMLFHIKEFWNTYLKARDLDFVILTQSIFKHPVCYIFTKEDFNVLNEKNVIRNSNEIEALFSNNTAYFSYKF